MFFLGFKLVENQKVIARWKDGKWYAATIVEASPIKAYLHFYDGDYSSVFVQHILPLVSIHFIMHLLHMYCIMIIFV